jgi:hypothetical protein
MTKPYLHAIGVPRKALRLPWGRIQVSSHRKPKRGSSFTKQLSSGGPEAYQRTTNDGAAVEIRFIKGSILGRLDRGALFDIGARALASSLLTTPFCLRLSIAVGVRVMQIGSLQNKQNLEEQVQSRGVHSECIVMMRPASVHVQRFLLPVLHQKGSRARRRQDPLPPIIGHCGTGKYATPQQ